MGSPGHPDRPSHTDVARFLTRKLLLSLIVLFGACYLVYTHSADISSEIDNYAPYIPDLHIPKVASPFHSPPAPLHSSPALSHGAGSGKPSSNKPPSEFHPHSHDSFAYLDLVKEFWAPWSKTFLRARPRVSEVRLSGNAGNERVEGDALRGPRSLSTNYVDLAEPDLSQMRDGHGELREALDAFRPHGALDELFVGRGVVMVGGGMFMSTAIVSIKMLRATGSELPVEVFLPGWDDYNEKLCEEYLPALNARCRLVSEFLSGTLTRDINDSIGHYQLRALALLFSSFRSVLLLDSDAMPLVDPQRLFDSVSYFSTGFVSWPDFFAATESPAFYDIAGVHQIPEGLAPTAPEAAQIVIDKHRHIKTILLAAYYNIFGPKHYYPLLAQGTPGQSDKETYEAAAIALNMTYFRVPKPVVELGRLTSADGSSGYRNSGMVQYLPEADPTAADATPAFVHANTPKMNAAHLVDEKDIYDDAGGRLRLWGTLAVQEVLFGRDLEKQVWGIVRDTACELAGTIKEWQSTDRLCERVEEHFNAVFT